MSVTLGQRIALRARYGDGASMLNYSSAVILALLDHIDARDAEIKSLLDDLRRYADPHDLSDPQNPRHVSVGLMGVRLRAMLGETPQ